MSSTRLTCAGNRALLVFLLFVLSACSDSGSSRVPLTAEAIDVAGSVGDGPVVNADLSFVDADGKLRTRYYGDPDGMNVRAELVRGDDGEAAIRFPFTISGL